MGCKYDFTGRRWKRVSKQAEAFVQDLLVEDPDERLTAEEASCSTWLNRRFGATTRGPTPEEMDSTTTSLTTYANYHKLKKLVCIIRLLEMCHALCCYWPYSDISLQLGAHGDCTQVNVRGDWDLAQSV